MEAIEPCNQGNSYLLLLKEPLCSAVAVAGRDGFYIVLVDVIGADGSHEIESTHVLLAIRRNVGRRMSTEGMS